MLKKIISGGQTGADRAALDATLEKQFPAGGFCPKGRMAEDGEIPHHYPLTELKGGYRQRTRMNVESSSGTVIFYQCYPEGGTEETLAFCIKRKKPYFLVDIDLISVTLATEKIVAFIRDHSIEQLNIAGPRLTKCPDIYLYVKETISQLVSQY